VRLLLLQNSRDPSQSTFSNITTAAPTNINPQGHLLTTTLSLFIQPSEMEQLLQHESHPATTIHRECRSISMDSPQVNKVAATGLSATQNDGNQAALDQTMSIDMLAHRFVNNVKVSDPLSFY
jgi:hypothetical protein